MRTIPSLILLAALSTVSAAASSSAVADAAMRRDSAAVFSLLKQGADVNEAQGDGMTAIHWAALNGDVELVQKLIDARAKLESATRIGAYTPLFLALRSGNSMTVAALVKAGANVNAATSTTGMTPLMLAAASGNVEIVRLLLEAGAQVNAKEASFQQTPLMFAAANNRVDVIRLLMAKGADASSATKVRGPGEAQAADDEGPPPAKDPLGGMTPLLYAARQGHLDAARALLDAGANVNQVSPADQTSPLLIAAINGRFDLAMFLLERGADPNLASIAGVTPLYSVINVQWAPQSFYPTPSAGQERTTYQELMKALLDRGADPNARISPRSLWYNVYASAGTGTANESGATAFWRAAQSSDIDAMMLLVAAKADPHIAANDGTTPLNVAAGAGWSGGFHTNSPIGWMQAVQYLVEVHNADVNRGNNQGYTPLHAAAERGDNEMILYLVGKGGDVTAVTRRGQTVADVANGPRQRIQPFAETIALITALGGRNSRKCVSC